jgi:predicted transposase YdaD
MLTLLTNFTEIYNFGHMAKSKHDSFFSASLEHPAIAKAFLQIQLPSHLKDEMVWEGLTRIDRTNTDFDLKKLQRDIIYIAPLKQGGTIILGLEHQSTEDLSMVLRHLRYYLNTLEAYLKGKKEDTKWPLLVSLLVSNGLKTPYPYPSDTTGCYEHGAWGNMELYFRFHLLALLQTSDKILLNYGCCAPVLLLLKYSRGGEFELQPSDYKKVFLDCIREVGERYISSMLEYADSLNFKIGEKLHKFVEEIFQDKTDIVMTYGQVLKKEAKIEGRQEGMQEGIQKGRQEGIQEGIQKGYLEITKSMLNKGLAISLIQELTGLNKETLEQLKQG